jgi:hypothetical protein
LFPIKFMSLPFLMIFLVLNYSLKMINFLIKEAIFFTFIINSNLNFIFRMVNLQSISIELIIFIESGLF